MKQVWIRYELWEDYINGMWRRVDPGEEAEMLQVAIEFTGDYVRYGKAMLRVINEWQNTCLNSLTNSSVNQKAHIGHCAVCLELGIPEYITRAAWKELTDTQRELADNEAAKAIKIWVQNQRLKATSKHGSEGVTRMEYPMRLL